MRPRKGLSFVTHLNSRAGVLGFAASVMALVSGAPALADAPSELAISAETFELAASGATDNGALPADDRAALAPQSETPDAPAAAPARPTPPPPKDVDLRIVASQFVDVPVAGDARSLARYSGRVDGYLEVRGSYYGGPSNLTLKIRPEYTWGKSSNGEIGLIPGNTALFRPEGSGDFDLSASVEYQWNSGATLEVGKINVLDISGQLPIVASDGHFGFQNLGLALPPTAVVPNTLDRKSVV